MKVHLQMARAVFNHQNPRDSCPQFMKKLNEYPTFLVGYDMTAIVQESKLTKQSV